MSKLFKDADLFSTKIDPAGLYRFRAFGPHIGYARVKWWSLQTEGNAPAPAYKPSKTVAAWRGADILEWLKDPETYAERVAARKAAAAKSNKSQTA